MLLHRHFEQNGEEVKKNMTTSSDVRPSRKFTEEGVDMTMNVTPPVVENFGSSDDGSGTPQRRGRPRRGN